MKATSLALALLLAVGLGLMVAPSAQAQEREGCYDGRFGSMGCMSDVRPFNFDDPAIAEYSAHRMRGYYIVHADMEMDVIRGDGIRPEPRPWMNSGSHR